MSNSELKVGRIPPPFIGEREKYYGELKAARAEYLEMLTKLEDTLNDPSGDMEYANRMANSINASEKRLGRLSGRPASPVEIDCVKAVLQVVPYQENNGFQIILKIK